MAPPIVIAVAGPSGSGKTTIAREIYKHCGDDQCLIISSDNYYKDLSHLSLQERTHTNFDHPDSIDFELLTQHVQLLKQGKSIDMPIYDFATHTRREETLPVSSKTKIILEGILILHPANLRSLYDTKLFVDTDLDMCLVRRLRRDMNERDRNMEEILTQYEAHVRPMFKAFVAPCKASADIIIANTAPCDITPFDVTLLIAHLDNERKPTLLANLSMLAEPTTPTLQDETYEAGYTYFT